MFGFASEQQMPAKATFEKTKEWLRHPAKVRFLDITILDVVGNAVGKDVLDFHFANAESVIFEKPTPFAARKGVGNRAAGLSFGVFCD